MCPTPAIVTSPFASLKAHALVFVLMSTRLFDKDEIEMVEGLIWPSGESRIAEKTFWVLNR